MRVGRWAFTGFSGIGPLVATVPASAGPVLGSSTTGNSSSIVDER